MANTIEATNGLSNTSFVPNTSRYVNSEIINYNIGNVKFLTFKTYKLPTKVTSNNDKFYVITAGTEYRPDIVSKKAYGTESYWWVLLQANNIKDIYYFKSGLTITIPSVLT